MTAATNRRALFSMFVFVSALAMTLILIALAAPPARADIPELSAWFDGPTPNPVAAGSSATVSGHFSVSGDIGAITIGLEIDADPGFGSLTLDSTSGDLFGCVTATTTITCVWDAQIADGVQTINATIAVNSDISPYSSSEIDATSESVTVPFGQEASASIGVEPPAGTTTLSGTAITDGGVPVENACIFVLSSPFYAFPTITDADGNWSLTGLPDDWDYVVAAIPPFDGVYGPCADDGPPQAPDPGELQPVFYDDIWIDLNDPGIAGDGHAFAVSVGATVLSDSTSGIVSCLTATSGSTVPRPSCLPTATTSLSGTVITDGGTPVANACIFLLASSGNVIPTISDAEGNWSVSELRDDWDYVVAVIGPYGDEEPCVAEGPPPAPAPGELQPVFFDDIWIDLADPDLTGGGVNPHDFAVAAGATVLSNSLSGLGSCLTTAPGSTVPRPPCIPPTTTTTIVPTTTTTVVDTLPVTGVTTTGVAIVGSLFVLLGTAVLAASRRRAF